MTPPFVDVQSGGFTSGKLRLFLKNVGDEAALIKKLKVAGDVVALPSITLEYGGSSDPEIDLSDMRIVNERVDEAELLLYYRSIGGVDYQTKAMVIQESRVDGKFNVIRIENSEPVVVALPMSAGRQKPSEKKRKLVEELILLHKALNVPQIYKKPNHKETKDWLANTSAVLKQLDESDYQAFMSLREKIYEKVPLNKRKDAAQKIDAFTREKKEMYKRYDFSNSDKLNNDVSASNTTNHETLPDRQWLVRGVVLAIIGVLVASVAAFFKWSGLVLFEKFSG